MRRRLHDERQATNQPAQPPPKGTRHCQQKHRAPRKTQKVSVCVTSLNIRGFGSENMYSPNNKWLHINQIMHDKCIGILVVQETHMDEARRKAVEDLFSHRLRILATCDPDGPTSRGE